MARTRVRPEDVRPIVTYPRDAVLEWPHLVLAFGVSEEIVKKMDLPYFMAGDRPRYIWGQVIDVLSERAMKKAS